jgi:hypothetical protein
MNQLFKQLFSFLLMGAVLIGVLFPITSKANSVSAITCSPGMCGDDCSYNKCDDGCFSAGQCIDNRKCGLVPYGGFDDDVRALGKTETRCGSYIIGNIDPPIGVDAYNNDDPTVENIGIIVFFSRVLNIFTIVAGLWVMMNFIMGGFEFVVNAGNSDTMSKVKDKLIYSLIGIVIIVAAYSAAGVIGLIFFDDASFILNPDISQYSALAQ